jgi:plastocyanin
MSSLSPLLQRISVGAVILASALHAPPAPADEATGEIDGNVAAAVAKFRANTVVYVKNAGLGTSSAVAKMDQRGLVFAPRVLPIQKGTRVDFLNSDPVGHNVFSPDGDKYDLGTWPKDETRSHTFNTSGVFRQLCRVHDDMIAFIVVVDTKYFALSDKSGAFKIGGLPPGKYTLATWNEKLGAKDVDVDVAAGKPSTVTISLEKR